MTADQMPDELWISRVREDSDIWMNVNTHKPKCFPATRYIRADLATPPKSQGVEVTEAVETGRKIMAHAEGWIPDACLIGNMTAHDIYRSVQTLIEAATRQHPTPEPQGEPVYELGTGNLIGHKYFVPLKGEK